MKIDRHSMKRLLLLLLALVMIMGTMSGCKKEEHSEYTNATVSIPSTYGSYTVDPMQFCFEAGWTSANYDSVQEEMDLLAQSLGITANLCIFTRLQSPVYDQGTVNYLDFGYFSMGHNITTKNLEDVMEMMNQLSSTVKKLSLSCSELSTARIRCYGEEEVEALTCCYKVSTVINDYTLTCVEQIALIPRGSYMYVIIYSDFTNTEDTIELERLLSSLTFSEK